MNRFSNPISFPLLSTERTTDPSVACSDDKQITHCPVMESSLCECIVWCWWEDDGTVDEDDAKEEEEEEEAEMELLVMVAMVDEEEVEEEDNE